MQFSCMLFPCFLDQTALSVLPTYSEIVDSSQIEILTEFLL